MRLFWEFTQRSFQRHLTYRTAALAGLATNFFFGLLRVSVLLALFGERQEVEGFTRAGLFTYIALTQAILAYLSMFGWFDLMNSVHSGEVANDLLKPMSFFNFWLARDLGRAAVALIFRGLTIMLLYTLFFEMVHPQSLGQWTAVAIAVFLSWFVSFAFRFLLNLAAFWTPNALGIARFGFIFSLFFSGFLMPLAFFPVWVQRLAYLTPFPHMLNTVVDVYVGKLEGAALAEALFLQLAWVVVLVVVGQIVLGAAVKRLVILGG
ncbi:MAG: ABC transporter permease [Chloroflexi bacterium]|nr:ABC transporter permease [Chloroflexota bacterium]